MAKPSWPNSCRSLLGRSVVRVLIWLISVVGICMNLISCLVIRLKVILSGDSYNTVILCLSISDMLSCISLLIIVSADAIFAHDYLNYDYNWRRSFLCHSSSTLSISANFLSIFMINLLAFSRYFVIKNPYTSKFLETAFLIKICLVAYLIIILLVLSSIVSYIKAAPNNSLPTSLCLLLGHSNKSVTSKVLTIVTFCSEALSCFIIPILYYSLLKLVAKSNMSIGQNSTHHDSHRKGEISKSIIVAFTNLVCWVPSCVLLCMTLVHM